MSNSRRRSAAVLALVIGAGIAGPTVARAQAPVTAPPGATVDSWAVTPSGTNPNEPGDRPALTYDVAPGTTMKDSVTIFNYGTSQLTFRVYPTDAFNNPQGGFDLLTGDKEPSDAGRWVSVAQGNITVPSRTSLVMPFTLSVPADARPGDHAGAILASSTAEGRDSEGRVVNLDRRTGTRLYVRVAGPLEPGLVVQKVETVYHSRTNPLRGSVDVTYVVRNVGNVRLGAHQLLELKNPVGRRMKKAVPADLSEVLPGNSVTVHAHFDGVTAAVRLTAKATLTRFPVGDPLAGDGGRPSGAGHTWAIPWALLTAVVALTLAWWARKRFRRPPAEEWIAVPSYPMGPGM